MQSVLNSGGRINLTVITGGRTSNRSFSVVKALGQGAFGSVYLVKDGTSRMALKIIKCPQKEIFDLARREIETMINLNHNNIIKIFGSDWLRGQIMGTPHACILMEYCVGGNLNSRLHRQSTEAQNLTWMVQTADALNYLASVNIVHRDLKPENVLLSADENIKVGDFGLAREYVALVRAGFLNFDDSLQYYMQTLAGSPWWMAPEVFESHYTYKADVFSLGTIFYAIIERKYVTYNGERFYVASVSHQPIGKVMYNTGVQHYPAFSLSTTRALKELVQDMLLFDSNSRPAADVVLRKIKSIQQNFEHPALIQGNNVAQSQPGWCC